MYKYRKQDGMHCIILEQAETVQFSSLDKQRAEAWLEQNMPEPGDFDMTAERKYTDRFYK